MKSGIVRKAIDPTSILKSVRSSSAGGTVLFLGTIRNRTNGEKVKGLEYEVYRQMADRRLSELEKEVKQRWPIKAIRLVHREGQLKTGEVSVAVAVSATHRREAFEAARFAIEQIKRRLPIWKLETFAKGRQTWSRGTPITIGSNVRRTSHTSPTRKVRQRKRIRVEA